MPRANPRPKVPASAVLAAAALAAGLCVPCLAAQPASVPPVAGAQAAAAPATKRPQQATGAPTPATPAAGADVAVVSVTGERLSEPEMARGTTIVVVWASWSPRCHDIVDRVRTLAGHWRAHARVVTLDFEEDRQAVTGFLAGKDLGVPVFLDLDGAFAKKYAIATLPGLLVVKEGRVTYHGRLPDDPDRVIGEAP